MTFLACRWAAHNHAYMDASKHIYIYIYICLSIYLCVYVCMFDPYNSLYIYIHLRILDDSPTHVLPGVSARAVPPAILASADLCRDMVTGLPGPRLAQLPQKWRWLVGGFRPVGSKM